MLLKSSVAKQAPQLQALRAAVFAPVASSSRRAKSKCIGHLRLERSKQQSRTPFRAAVLPTRQRRWQAILAHHTLSHRQWLPRVVSCFIAFFTLASFISIHTVRIEPSFNTPSQSPFAWAAVQAGLWRPDNLHAHCPAFPADHLPPDVASQRLFIAANLKDSGFLMENFRVQLLQVIQYLNPDRVFVSIYESNSKDDTPRHLERLTSELTEMGVPHRIVINAPDRRLPDEDRIDFLVRMRNRALEPMFEPHGHAHGGSNDRDGGEAVDMEKKEAPRFDSVVFINDVYFCAWHILRLLAYRADLACGMDFKLPSLRDMAWRAQQGLYTESRFYDIWVARDEAGERFEEDPPFVRHAHGYERDTRSGFHDLHEPFGVYCCWNGMAVMRAAPFYEGLRFRASRPGQPVQSECSFLCDDLWASKRSGGQGGARVIVDPLVRLTYEPRTALYMERHPGVPTVRNIAELRHRDVAGAPLPERITACYLDPGPKKKVNRVDYRKCATRDPLLGAVSTADLCVSTITHTPHAQPTAGEGPKVASDMEANKNAVNGGEEEEEVDRPFSRVVSIRGPVSSDLVASWKELHPGYQVQVLLDNEAEDLARQSAPWVTEAIESLRMSGHHATVRKMVTYGVVRQLGGVVVQGTHEAIRSVECVWREGRFKGDLVVLDGTQVREVGGAVGGLAVVASQGSHDAEQAMKTLVIEALSRETLELENVVLEEPP